MLQLRLGLSVIIILSLLLVPASGILAANVIHVNCATGSDTNDGLTWDTAKRTVTAGVTAAVSGDQVWVAKGVYTEGVNLTAGVALYGGFAGSESDLTSRDWTANVTAIKPTASNNAIRVTGTPSARIDGFSLMNGGGDGVQCASSSPTITNNRILNNRGSGVSCNGSSPLILHNIISLNSSGVLCVGGSSPLVMANRISSSLNAAVECQNSSPVICNNGIVANNYGVLVDQTNQSTGTSAPTIVNNTIVAALYAVSAKYKPGASIANNIITLCQYGLYLSGDPAGDHSWRRNNCFYGNTISDCGALAPAPGDIFQDPKLAGLHIQPDSPCRNAGSNSAVQTGWTDLDGQNRNSDGSVDIGADESDGTSWDASRVTMRVTPEGSDQNDGLGWDSAHAKKTVQEAIDAASTLGGEVWVRAGVYNECVFLAPFVDLYGGFAGSEVNKDQRNRQLNTTVLDGQQAGTVIVVQNPTAPCTIDGFTVRNGNALATQNGVGCRYGTGGGVYVSGGTVTITHNTIRNNVAAHAGGIQCGAVSATIANNTIVANRTFQASMGHGDAGGARCSSSLPGTITNNLFSSNACGFEGGAIHASGSTTIANNVMLYNSAGYSGGAIYTGSGGNATIANNTMLYNTSMNSALWVDGPGLIANNIVAFNFCGIVAWGEATFRRNCVYGNGPGGLYDYIAYTEPPTDDISVDPRLVSTEYGEYHLQPNSPCVNAGYDVPVQAGWTDIDDQLRVVGAHVDIGADESDGVVRAFTPVVVRVSPQGNDANDGAGWDSAHAMLTVQAAIDKASAVGGDVWVAAGTYQECISLKPCVYVYGGFAGNETARTQRNWIQNRTILDGQQAGSVVNCGQAGNLVSAIDGFTIRNGKATAGGGVFCSYGATAIRNDNITGNTATVGAGIYCRASFAPICSCILSDNSATGSGGGVYLHIAGPDISGCILSNNSAGGKGGGIFAGTSYSTVTNNTLVGNSAPEGGAISYSDDHTVTANNVIAFNSSGLFNDPSHTPPPGQEPMPTPRNNCVFGNTAYNYSGLVAGPGDVSADPLLVDKEHRDFHLSAGSPCIDSGWNDAAGIPLFDIDGFGRVFNRKIDMGADEYWSASMSIPDAKFAPDNAIIAGTGAAITAAFPDFLYIESDSRSSGIRVDKPAHGLSVGTRADITGTMATNADGERCIVANTATANGDTTLSPLGLNLTSLGGGSFGLQEGVFGWTSALAPDGKTLKQWGKAQGLNTIGLLVRTAGKFEYVDEHTFTLDDGSGLKVKCIAPQGVSLDPTWAFASVTGISSCERTGSELHRILRIRTQGDIAAN